jgi:3,4-dihydroxy 2-butanone 4-phosphate synthase/GTP cyclohydrolase II
MLPSIERVQSAIHTLRKGGMIILVDGKDREHEGDLIAPAETITPEQMNFMIRHSSGIVCLPMDKSTLQKLQLPLMVQPQDNTSSYGTPFTISIDSKKGITTGVSAQDRVHTIRSAIAEHALPTDLVKPGHVFPLQAKDNGVLERQGHTEGSIDLVKLAGFKPAAVLSEIMNADGTMAKGHQLEEFAKTHHLPLLTIEDLITYRLTSESCIEESATALLPLDQYGLFNITVVREKYSHTEHTVLRKDIATHTQQPPLVRIHSACMTGDLFGSTRCDCYKQLHYALKHISQEGGMLLYLNQEGRGIGLLNKIKAYQLQENGLDTVEANEQLGLAVDARQYHIAGHILRAAGLDRIRLLTNNPSKLNALKACGIKYIEQINMPVFCNKQNYRYLKTKQEKLNHTINLDNEWAHA